jgi:hypothetical protein
MCAISALHRRSGLSGRRRLLRIDKYSVAVLSPEPLVVREPDPPGNEGKGAEGRYPEECLAIRRSSAWCIV